MHIIRKTWKWFLLGFLAAIGIAACGVFNPGAQVEQLPSVAPLETPKPPAWIEEISPTGEAENLAQIRIRFQNPVIPIASLDSPNREEKLTYFEITPQLPGEFRFLTPRMVGFQAAEALPSATRIQVKVKAGLEDVNQNRLGQDLAWTFTTKPIQLSNLPTSTVPYSEDEIRAIALEPNLEFTSNVELDLSSLEQHLRFIPENSDRAIAATVRQQEIDSDLAIDEFNSEGRSWHYEFTPKQQLEKATTYRIEFAAGIEPKRGNLASEKAFSSEVQTYAPLAFNELQFFGQPDAGGAYGRFVRGAAQLQFNNGLNADSALNNITIAPSPKDEPQAIQAYDEETSINLNPYAFEPNTRYQITLGADLEDRFGQKLGEPVTVTYETGDLAADFWAPSELNIFPAGTDLNLNFSAINLPDSEYKAVYRRIRPTDLVYADSAYPRGEGNDLLPSPNTWQTFPISGQKNQTVEITVPVREQLNAATGLLAYGVQAKTNSYQENGRQRWREATYYGLVELTNLGVFAQWFPESGIVKVNHLDDGSAASGIPVEIYQSRLNSNATTTPQTCATGTTDATGFLQLNAAQMRRCRQSATEAPELLVIARENSDWAFVRTYAYSGNYGYGFFGGWYEDRPLSRGTIFSDRQLYKPGETVELTGVASYLDKGELVLDKNDAYSLILRDPDGNEIDLGQQTTNDFGTFSLEIPLEETQSLGYYTVEAKANNDAQIFGEFRVAEFKPPNFKVELSVDKQVVVANEGVEAKTQSDYLFGAPVSEGRVTYYVTRSRADFSPKGWENYQFGQQWFWPEEEPQISPDVLQETDNLDGTGWDSFGFTIDKDLPYTTTYRVDAEVSDVSNLSVANSQTITALPSDRLIGLKTNFVAEAGESFPVEVVVTDADGNAIAGNNVRLELQKMDYSRVTRVVEGSRQQRYQVEYQTQDSQTVKSSRQPVSVSLKAAEAGSYRIRATSENDDRAVTDLQLWVTGSNAVVWGDRSDSENFLEVKLDKESYRPGETATALIQSPYPEAELYFAVVRDRPLYQTTVKVSGGAPEVRFKVTEDMLPNAAVQAVLVRQGTPIDRVEPGSVEDLVKVGFAPFTTSLEDKYLQVTVDPVRSQLEPGATEGVQLQVTDREGKPVRAQFTVMVVNEAVLQLTGYRPPDLVETVYAEQPIATRWDDSRFEVILQALASPLDKGWGYGGGFSAGIGETRVRTEFSPLAYYNGSIVSDRQGRARVDFPLPDDLTTWRVMAVATTEDLRFGKADSTFITTKPVMANPLLPQFARPGDRFQGGLAVTNTTGDRGRLDIEAAVSQNLQFAQEKATQTTSRREKLDAGTHAYRFAIAATELGEGNLRFAAQLNNREADAFEVPLPVLQLPVTENVVDTGTTGDRATIPLNIDEKVMTDIGGLQLDLASTLIPEITAPARRVFDEQTLPFLEPTASQLAIAANLQQLGERYAQAFAEFNPSQQATQALTQLQKLQTADGGFASWPGYQRSDPFMSAYAAESLAKAKQAGFAVDGAMVSQLQGYLKQLLADPGQYDWCDTASCKGRIRLGTLIALSELGETRNDFLAEIYQGRADLDRAGQSELARYLLQFPEWQPEGRSLADELFETVSETARSAAVNLPRGWSWLSDATALQAQTLRLGLAANTRPETIDRLLQGLLNLRRNGTWGSTYANAEALNALVAYGETQPTPPNFTATVVLGGETLDSMQFRGYENPSRFLNVAIDRLPKGSSELVLAKSGSGTLHYVVDYSYRLPGNQPGRFNGLRVERQIKPVGEDEAIATFGLAQPDKPLSVEVGQVFDIAVETICDRPVDRVVITDPLPAGFEAIDTSFQTSTQAMAAQADSWEIGYQQIYKDRIVAYADRLEPGSYTLHYLVRSVTPGQYEWPGAEVHLQYAPEEFGRSASATLEVK
ncbi:MAG: alpha-2-macroglobulin family protein [Cyanobacteria bacterium J007]|nr:MAG: alpha-2-macroglobulin family protein [Cyanobacteria bacterium J007]